MRSSADTTLIVLTIMLVLAVGAVGWWSYQLYLTNVAQTDEIDVLERDIQQLEDSVEMQSQTIMSLSDDVALANDGRLRRAQQLESQIADLDTQVGEIRGTFWQSGFDRDLGQLDDDLATVESSTSELESRTSDVESSVVDLERNVSEIDQCVESIASLAEGAGSLILC